MGYSFRLTARVLLYASPTDRIAHTTAYVTPVMEHWLEREIAKWVHHEGLIRRPITLWRDNLPLSYILLYVSADLFIPVEDVTPICVLFVLGAEAGSCWVTGSS